MTSILVHKSCTSALDSGVRQVLVYQCCTPASSRVGSRIREHHRARRGLRRLAGPQLRDVADHHLGRGDGAGRRDPERPGAGRRELPARPPRPAAHRPRPRPHRGHVAVPLPRHLYRGAYWRRGPVTMTAISAVDTALWDIKGKVAGLPVYQLLGGRSRSGVSVYGHANGATIDDGLSSVAAFVSRGYRAVRIQAAIPEISEIYGV